MTGKFNGVQGFINQHLEENEKGHKIHFFHCVIHQEFLCKNSMKLNHVDDVIDEFLKNIKIILLYIGDYVKILWIH